MNKGDYVRTKHLSGSIERIIKIIPRGETEDFIERYITDISVLYNVAITPDMIIKTSPNIIDLIEVGDYVNGHLVKNRRASCNENLCGHPKQVDIGENEDSIWISESKIKSIVTKEQFSSMEYKVESEVK